MAGRTARLPIWLPSLGDIAFLMPLLFLFARMQGMRGLLVDGDTGWHIRAGEWILAHGRAPRLDLFSYTMPGRPWFAWEWLSEVTMAFLHRQGGLAAVALAAILILSVTFAALYFLLCAREGNPLVAIVLTGMAVAGSSIHWLARPHLATLLCVVAVLAIVESRRPGLLWLLPPLTLLWANLHPGFVLGIGLTVAYALGRRRAEPALAAAASLLASLANPYGWHLHAHIAGYLSKDSWQFAHINEFFSPNFHSPVAVYLELALALSVAAACWHLARGRFHYALLIAVTGHMALVSARHIPIFLVVGALVIARAANEWLPAAAQSGGPEFLSRIYAPFLQLGSDISAVEPLARVSVWSIGTVAGLVMAVAPAGAAGKLRAEFDPELFPVRAVDSLRAAGRTGACRIYTSDQWGDYLIYRLYPEIRVFVDGRSDFYGSDLEQTSLEVWNVHYDWQNKLGRYQVDTVLLPTETPLAGALKESGRWRVVYDDGRAIIFHQEERVSGSSLALSHLPEETELRSESK
jgi:hypothetical protein